MDIKSQFGLASLLCLINLSVFAQTAFESNPVQTSRSIGKRVSDSGLNLLEAVKGQKIVSGKLLEPATIKSRQQLSAIANRHDQYFSIYDADVELLSDIDGDGYHHALNVIFDVDVDYDRATLYAKLYLSREGGPWIQYATSDLFNIFQNDVGDTYEVTTELVEGYPPGYYAVLVEIYSLNHTGMVTSDILDRHYLGKEIMLEDINRDEGIVFEEVAFSISHGAGSFSLFFWLLLVQVVIAARGVLTLYPRKTIIIKDAPGLRFFVPASVAVMHSTRQKEGEARLNSPG